MRTASGSRGANRGNHTRSTSNPAHRRRLPRQPHRQLPTEPEHDVVGALGRHRLHLQVGQVRQLRLEELPN
jgi:hypothetical protein